MCKSSKDNRSESGRQFCVKSDRHQTRRRRQIKGMHMRGTAQLSQASPLVSHLGNTMVKPGSGSLAALEHKLGKNHFSISTSGRIRHNKMRKLNRG